MTKDNIISVSMGNTKMGPIPSFSVMPGVCCSCNAKNTCFKKGCYARRLLRYKTVFNAWSKNHRIVRSNPRSFFNQLDGWLSIYQPQAFRFNVGGDWWTDDYFIACCDVAKANPKIKFFGFTKCFDTIRRCEGFIPKNLSVILSAWIPSTDGWCPPIDLRKKFPVAWVTKHNQPMDDIFNAMKSSRNGHYKYSACRGNCESCGMCFNLKRKDGDILFEYH